MNDHLKDCREGRGLSQAEAAEQLGVTRQALSNWELGRTEPDVKSLSALAKLYGKTVDELLHGTPEKPMEEPVEELAEDVPEIAPEAQPVEMPEEQMVEAPEEQPMEPLEIVPEEPTATRKKSLSAKTRALLLALAVLLSLALGFAAGWYACDYAQSHKVYEKQVDLSKPYDTLEFFPIEDN